MPAATYTATDDAGNPTGSVQFTLLLSGAGRSAEGAVDDKHIPGGDQNFVDLGGQMTGTWEADGLFASYADFESMLGFCNHTGTLAYTEDVPSIATSVTLTVVLKKVARKRSMGRGSHYASLNLLILA